jgi:hypothetical protein
MDLHPMEREREMKRKHLGTTVVLGIIFMVWSAACTASIEVQSASTEIVDDALHVKFTPLKPEFEVNEPIRFKVKGNRTFYLYLFSIVEDSDEGYMILPNALQQYVKYKANREYIVPEKNIEFYAEKPGTEKLIVVASTEKLPVKIEKFRKEGQLYAASAEFVEAEVKTLKIRQKRKEHNQVIQQLFLNVSDNGVAVSTETAAVTASSPAATEAQPPAETQKKPRVATFVSSDKTEYKTGEVSVITYGADTAGYIYLFVIEPQGKQTLLKKSPVDGKSFLQVRGVMTPPEGTHRLLAVYDKQGDLPEAVFQLSQNASIEKGIELLDENQRPFAVYHLNVMK